MTSEEVIGNGTSANMKGRIDVVEVPNRNIGKGTFVCVGGTERKRMTCINFLRVEFNLIHLE